MRKIQAASLALLIALAAILPLAPVAAVGSPPPSSRYAPGEIIVKLKESAREITAFEPSDRLIAVGRFAGRHSDRSFIESVEPVAAPATKGKVGEIISRHGLDRTYVLKFDAGADVDAIIAGLKADEGVEYAEPNYRIKAEAILPEDPGFGNQWPLKNLGFIIDEYPATLGADIKATEAWEVTTGSPDVIVAVTDTGVDRDHPDLRANIYTNAGEIAGNGIDDDRNGYIDDVHGYNVVDQNGDTSDIVGHGTQMAGIIAAEMGNSIGITGVAQSKILPVRFFERTGPRPEEYDATVADAARALLYSIAAGASIINASWRTLLAPGVTPEDHALALRDAVAATNDAGALLVCIAGNEGFDNDLSKVYPGAYQLPNQIVVAASNFNDEIWHVPYHPWIITTGFGQKTVHLAAPGVSIFTTSARGNCVLCTESEDPAAWYARTDGTSASAAYVSGVAALVKSKYPDDSSVLIKRRILEGVDVLANLQPYVITSGRLNANRALAVEINITPPVLTKLKYKSGGGKLVLSGSGIQAGAVAVVADRAYPATPSGDLSSVTARVPKSAFPKGVEVPVKLRNPDGGLSQKLTFKR